MKIEGIDIDDLARGAALLGSGGGGDPYIGALLLSAALDENPPTELIDVDDLSDDALVVPVAMMGAPTVLLEKFPNGSEAERVLRKLEEILGKPADAIIAAEIGGGNALLPLTLGAQLGLPVVDGDGMGRAFPALHMVTFHVGGVPISPMTMTDEHGNVVTIDGVGGEHVERLARHVVMAMGGAGVISLYPMTGAQAKATTVKSTIAIALGIGRAIRIAREANEDPFQALAKYLESSEHYTRSYDLIDGKIVDLDRQTRAGFAVGMATIESPNKKDTLIIEFQNENLVAYLNGELCAMVPDLICILDSETAEPITTEGLRYGQRVRVVAIGAPPILRSDAALEIMGPKGFGYDAPYQPIEDLMSNFKSTADQTSTAT